LTLNSRSGIRTEDLENVDSRATAFVTYIPQRDVRTRLQRCGDFAKLRVLEFLVVRYYVRYRVADRFARRAIDHATAVCPCISIYRCMLSRHVTRFVVYIVTYLMYLMYLIFAERNEIRPPEFIIVAMINYSIINDLVISISFLELN